MEIAVNSAFASSSVTHNHHPISIIGGGEATFSTPKLLVDHNDNICNNNYNKLANSGILNFFGTPAVVEGCVPKKNVGQEEVNALASITLKNALNLNGGNANANENLIHKLAEKTKLTTQCNGSRDLTQEHCQHTNGLSKASELLAALKVTSTSKQKSTTGHQAINKTNNILNASSTSSSASTSTPSSLSSTCSSLSLLSTTPTKSSTSATETTSPISTTITTASTFTTTNTPNAKFTKTVAVDVGGTPIILSNSPVTSIAGACESGKGHGNSNIKNGSQIPSDILDDLASRFIINVPDMELNNMIRICFQVELAHWFYLDFFCASAAAATTAADQQKLCDQANKKRKLPSCGIKQFALQLFQHIPFLREHLSSIDKILDDWKNYKLAVPTFGAILISEDLNFCLLVQSYFAKCSWGFPKGKVNENEDPVHCATREVYEETGYDITHLIVPNDYIEAVINYQYTRLYIVRDVSLSTQFSPRTRNEIKCCDWFPIDSLPINKNDAISKAKLGLNANSFFMIMPFVKRLKRWVHDKRAGIDTQHKYANGELSHTPTTLMATAAVAAAAVAAVGGTKNYSCNINNQKQNNTNSGSGNNSSKKTKQQHTNTKNDDKHINKKFLKGSCIGNTNINGIECATNSATNNHNTKSDNSKRSKRQRHKSMGDLDGIKFNNLSSNNCNNNTNSNTNTNKSICKTPNAVEATAGCQKRNGSAVKQLVAAGSNDNVQPQNAGNHCNVAATSKRQLFHSQSQNDNMQNGEKLVSSFDLIRKEKKQQLKAAAQADKGTKAQNKQQMQLQTQSEIADCGGRVRAKSQGDKMCVQLQQQQHEQNANKTNISVNNNNNNNGGNQKRIVQKQQSMIIANANTNTAQNNSNTDNNNKLSIFAISNAILNSNRNTAINTAKIPSSNLPTSSGSELLALATTLSSSTPSTSTSTLLTTMAQRKQQRPASVALHFEAKPAEAVTQVIQQQLQRMASGTNLRILKRSTSLQTQQQQPKQQQQPVQSASTLQLNSLFAHATSQQQQQQNQQQEIQQTTTVRQQQQQQQQQTELKFKPSFNSWTNFSFTKNFIANVFC